MADGKQRHPWSQGQGEPPKLYALFLRYAKLPLERRTIKTLAEETGLSYDNLAKLSGRYRWISRADEWEAWRNVQREHAQEHATVEAFKKQANAETKAVWLLAESASLAAERWLQRLRETPRFIPVLDKQGQPVMEVAPDGTPRQKMKENAEWTPLSLGTLADIVKIASELGRGLPESSEELDRRNQREALLSKLRKIIESHEQVSSEQSQPPTT